MITFSVNKSSPEKWTGGAHMYKWNNKLLSNTVSVINRFKDLFILVWHTKIKDKLVLGWSQVCKIFSTNCKKYPVYGIPLIYQCVLIVAPINEIK